MRIRLKQCSGADREHVESLRQYMHTGHYRDTICYAEAFKKLPQRYQAGLLAHELGHIIMIEKRQAHFEPDADWAAQRYLKVTVRYFPYTIHGEDLQYLDKKDLVYFSDQVSYDQLTKTLTVYP